MAIHKTEGIILSRADWSESSQTLTVFTPDKGKIALNVRGSRQLSGKRGRPLRLARLEFSCYIKDEAESGYLSDVEPVEVFLFEKEGQLGRLAFASAAVELLNNLLTTLDPQPACYQITLSFLRMTDQLDKKRLPGVFVGYILRLVSLLGYRPNLAGCVGCGKEIVAVAEENDEVKYLFSARRGGIVCEDCRKTVPDQNQMIEVPAVLFEKLGRLMRSSLEEAARVKVGLEELNIAVDLIVSLLKFHAPGIRPLKSIDFLDKLTRAAKTYGG